jgi:hypothetical protein
MRPTEVDGAPHVIPHPTDDFQSAFQRVNDDVQDQLQNVFATQKLKLIQNSDISWQKPSESSSNGLYRRVGPPPASPTPRPHLQQPPGHLNTSAKVSQSQ